ncbi:insulin-like growth factor 2 mRNA-binding protein 2 [Hydra vulgaris]|uniref:Insulin-like growth factor 2 mRNA-binding protein 2 n=1 Tax=Hydra vulgaris TaxID=6087 RepID=T2M2A4_HYDVU|nr:insulin-like growth factor 2 mRNA-binding protein 2 [Hydra vulgaris]
MPHLLFQFRRNDTNNEYPTAELLEKLLQQHSLCFDRIVKEDNDSVSVNFKSPEDAKTAYKTFDEMEISGSIISIKPARKEIDRANETKEKRIRSRFSKNKDDFFRHDYSKDQDGYPQRQKQSYNQHYDYNRHQIPQQYPCRILVPSDMVKVLLGKGGCTITAMQTNTGTKIDIHRDKGPCYRGPCDETIVTIKGDPESFSKAIREILSAFSNEYEKRDTDARKPIQLKLLAHDLLCGRIIGKGGNNLKQTKQESNVSKLIISNSIYEESSQMIPTGFVCTGERVITIEGSLDAICIAESLISKKLREYMEKDARNQYNTNMGLYHGAAFGGQINYGYNPQMYPRMYGGYTVDTFGYPAYPSSMNNYPGILGHGYLPYTPPQQVPYYSNFEPETTCILIPTKEVGAIIGRNGGYISRMKQYSGAQIRVIKGDEGGESKVEIVGPPDCQWRASLCVFSKIKETMKVAYSEAQLKTEFIVPGSCVGRVIGKKGQVVQDIQDKAQADIEVPKDKQGANDVPVYITGTFNGTQIAISRIRDIVHRARQKSDPST